MGTRGFELRTSKEPKLLTTRPWRQVKTAQIHKIAVFSMESFEMCQTMGTIGFLVDRRVDWYHFQPLRPNSENFSSIFIFLFAFSWSPL